MAAKSITYVYTEQTNPVAQNFPNGLFTIFLQFGIKFANSWLRLTDAYLIEVNLH